MPRKKKGPTLKEWLSSRLSQLDLPDPDLQLTTHILSLKDVAMREYGQSFFGDSELTNLLIEETIYKRKFGVKAVYRAPKTQKVSNVNLLKKPFPGSTRFRTKPSTDVKDVNAGFDNEKKHGVGTQMVNLDRYAPNVTKKKKKKRGDKKETNDGNTDNGGGYELTSLRFKQEKKKKGKKYGQLEEKIRRNYCGCQATKHNLFTNCTCCGYVLCVEEGEGSCYLCGALVYIDGSIPLSEPGKDIPMPTDMQAYKNAIANKNMILGFVADGKKRERVLDDQGDYYEDMENNMWLNKEQREIAGEMAKFGDEELEKGMSKRDNIVTIDIKNKKVYTHKQPKSYEAFNMVGVDRGEGLVQANVSNLGNKSEAAERYKGLTLETYYANPTLSGQALDIYQRLKDNFDDVKQQQEKDDKERTDKEKRDRVWRKNQEKWLSQANEIESDSEGLSDPEEKINLHAGEFEVIYTNEQDRGVTLSMHQPWASLLVKGIKKVEGRGWSTKFRGRLWIASATRIPTPAETEEVEDSYCEVYGLDRSEIPFPENYPTSALLGCVDVVNCVDNETYKEDYFQTGKCLENNASSHIFFCRNPHQMLMPRQIKGQHKFWNLPTDVLSTFQSGLRKSDINWCPKRWTPPLTYPGQIAEEEIFNDEE